MEKEINIPFMLSDPQKGHGFKSDLLIRGLLSTVSLHEFFYLCPVLFARVIVQISMDYGHSELIAANLTALLILLFVVHVVDLSTCSGLL